MKKKRFIQMFVVVIMVMVMGVFVGCGNGTDSEVATEESKKVTETTTKAKVTSTTTVTDEEKDACIDVINMSSYRSDIPTKTWGNIISTAFLSGYEMDFKRISENEIEVTFSGRAMQNPNFSVTAVDCKLVLSVNLTGETCKKKSISGLDDNTLTAYAMDGF